MRVVDQWNSLPSSVVEARTVDSFERNLSLNGLLVTRQMDNISPGCAPGGKPVPDFYKRCELGHTVIRHFIREDKRIRDVTPVPDSLLK